MYKYVYVAENLKGSTGNVSWNTPKLEKKAMNKIVKMTT